MSNACRWSRHTHVDNWCVSTIGEYHPGLVGDKMDDVGPGRRYETLIFDIEGPSRWSAVEGWGSNSRDEARETHNEGIDWAIKQSEAKR